MLRIQGLHQRRTWGVNVWWWLMLIFRWRIVNNIHVLYLHFLQIVGVFRFPMNSTLIHNFFPNTEFGFLMNPTWTNNEVNMVAFSFFNPVKFNVINSNFFVDTWRCDITLTIATTPNQTYPEPNQTYNSPITWSLKTTAFVFLVLIDKCQA